MSRTKNKRESAPSPEAGKPTDPEPLAVPDPAVDLPEPPILGPPRRRVIRCHFCGEAVELIPKNATQELIIKPHTDIYPTRWCEGGNRAPGDMKRRSGMDHGPDPAIERKRMEEARQSRVGSHVTNKNDNHRSLSPASVGTHCPQCGAPLRRYGDGAIWCSECHWKPVTVAKSGNLRT